jgi:hypothetical protein
MPNADHPVRPRAARESYAVELPGRLSPSVLRSVARAGKPGSEVRSVVESVFVLNHPDEGLPEVAARLHDHGLVVLGIRRLTPDVHREPRRTPPREAPPTGEDRP